MYAVREDMTVAEVTEEKIGTNLMWRSLTGEAERRKNRESGAAILQNNLFTTK